MGELEPLPFITHTGITDGINGSAAFSIEVPESTPDTLPGGKSGAWMSG